MKTVLITGANRGIGLEHVARYVKSGAKVFAGVRDVTKAENLKRLADTYAGQILLFDYDAADAGAPAAAKAAIKGASLDLVFANAGVYGDRNQQLGTIDAGDFANTLAINTIAPLRLVEALVDEVGASARKIIAFQSSKMGSNADSRSGGSYVYRASKAALNKIASTLAEDLKPRGITVVTLHPGWVCTDMGGSGADISVAECVDGQQALLRDLTLAKSGGFYNYDGDTIAW